MGTQQDPRLTAPIAQARAEGLRHVLAARQSAVRAGTTLSRVAADCDALVSGSARRVDILIRQTVAEAVRALADAEAAAAAAERVLRTP